MSNSSLFTNDAYTQKKAMDNARKNFSLKVGIVIKTVEIGQSESGDNVTPLYDVLVHEQDCDDPTTPVRYRNCLALSHFGGISDYFEARYRINKEEDFDDPIETQEGSMVLLLCINGNSFEGIIIGAVKHPRQESKLTEEAGHHMEGEFNGINWQVNKDGELTITFKSSSDNEGKYADEEAGGSFVKMEKDGSIELNDGKAESIKINKTDQTIDINAEKDISMTTKANVKVTAEESMEISTKMDWIAKAEGKANLEAKSMIDVKTDGAMKVKALDCQLMLDNSMMIKTNSFMMQAESALFNNTQTIIGSSPVPAVVLTTQFIGTGNLGMPIVSTSIGPYSSSVLIST